VSTIITQRDLSSFFRLARKVDQQASKIRSRLRAGAVMEPGKLRAIPDPRYHGQPPANAVYANGLNVMTCRRTA